MGFVPLSTRMQYPLAEANVRTILGEAGNQGPTGQLAVANVIQNRTNAGNFGSGYGIIQPSQFNGFDTRTPVGSPAYNSAAAAYQQSLQPGSDVTGGALYFANPGASSASWARGLDSSNSLTIGAHQFTDQLGGASSNYSMAGQSIDPRTPIGSAGSTNSYPFDASAGDAGMLGGFPSSNSSIGGINGSTSPYGGFTSASPNLNSWGTADPNQSGFTGSGSYNSNDFSGGPSVNAGTPGFDSAGNPMGAGDIIVSKAAPIGPGGSGSGSSPIGGVTGGDWESTGATAVKSAGATVAAADTAAANTISGGVQTASSNLTTTGTTWLDAIFTNASDYFVRGGVLLFGLIFLAGGVYFFSRTSRA